MTLNNVGNKVSVAAIAWIAAVVVAGIVASVDSPRGWLMLNVIALGPGAVLLYIAKEVPRTTSQAIQEARR